MTGVRTLALVLAGLFLSAFLALPVAAAEIGVVLLPGKNGTSGPKSLLGPLQRELEKAGMLVATPTVPWSKARAMVAAGRGGEKAAFADNNQGRTFDITAPARAYLSWFDTDGPAIFGKNAAFAKAPAHPKSAYVIVSGGHKDPIRNETARIRDWIKSLN